MRLVQSDGSADLLMSNNRHPSPLSRAASLRSPISPTSTMRRVGWASCMIAMTCRCWCARVRKLPRALSLGCRCRWWTGVLLAGQVGRCVHWGSPRGGDAEEAIRMTIVAQRKRKKIQYLLVHGPPTLIRGAAVDPHWIWCWGCGCWVVGAVQLFLVGDAAYLMWHCARAQGGWGA